MSRKPLQSILDTVGILDANDTGKLYKVALGKIDQKGKIDITSLQAGKFDLNPESWEESIDTNWVQHQIPGQSSQILQWVSGGPRALAFDALITKDSSDFLNTPADPLSALADTAINAVGSIASNFLGINLPPIGDLLGGFTQGPGEVLGINQQLDYFRSLLYPVYSNNEIDSSPPLLVLYSGKSFDNANTYPGTSSINSSTTVWVLTNLKIRITKQLPNLTPMEAMASFRLVQYPFKSLGQEQFSQTQLPSGNDLVSAFGNFV